MTIDPERSVLAPLGSAPGLEMGELPEAAPRVRTERDQPFLGNDLDPAIEGVLRLVPNRRDRLLPETPRVVDRPPSYLARKFELVLDAGEGSARDTSREKHIEAADQTVEMRNDAFAILLVAKSIAKFSIARYLRGPCPRLIDPAAERGDVCGGRRTELSGRRLEISETLELREDGLLASRAPESEEEDVESAPIVPARRAMRSPAPAR